MLKILIKLLFSFFLLTGISLFATPSNAQAAVTVSIDRINAVQLPSPGDTVSVDFTVVNGTATKIFVFGARVNWGPSTYLSPNQVDAAIGNGVWVNPWSTTAVTGFAPASIIAGGCDIGSVSVTASVIAGYWLPNDPTRLWTTAVSLPKSVGSIGAGLWGYVKKNGVGLEGATVTITGADGTQSYTSSANGYYEFKHLNCRVSHTLTASSGTWSGAVYDISSNNPYAFICNGDWKQINVPIYPPSPSPSPSSSPSPSPPPGGCTPGEYRYICTTSRCP